MEEKLTTQSATIPVSGNFGSGVPYLNNEYDIHQLVDSLPVAYYTCDKNGYITYFNKSCVDLWGRAPEIGNERWNGAWKIYGTDGAPLSLEDTSLGRTLKERKPVAGNPFIIERPDGSRRVTLPHPKLLFDENGTVIGAYNILVDITEQKNTEYQLRESEERFKMIANNAPVMIWMSGPEQYRNFFNKQWFEFTGLTFEDVNGDKWISSIHPDDVERVKHAYSNAFNSHLPFQKEYRLRRHDGEYRWMLSNCTPRFSSEDNTFLGFIGALNDITDRKMAAEDLEHLVSVRTSELTLKNEELLRQNEFIQTVLDSSVDLISVYDKDTRIITFNKKCEELLKIEGRSVIGKRYLELFPGLEETPTYQNLLRALEGEASSLVLEQAAYSDHSFHIFMIPLRHNNEVYAALALVHDITELIKAKYELEQKNKQLELSNRELEQFAYAASHDLQEPLRKIVTFIDRFKEHSADSLDETSLFYLNKIVNSSERMSHLIRDVLDYSRLGHLHPSFDTVDLSDALREVLKDLELLIQEKKARISFESLPTIEAVDRQMRQLMYNLIANSLKFSSPDNTPQILITSEPVTELLVREQELDPAQQYCQIIFKDNGIGFDQVYAEKIFGIFQRLNGKTEYAGTGIGLSLCRKITEIHHGKIIAESFPGSGALFKVILPIQQPQAISPSGNYRD